MKKQPRNFSDRLQGTLHPDLHPSDLSGSIGLLPDVLFPNQHATGIDEYGQVEGFEVDLGENPDGRYVFVSDPDGSQETMSRQVLEPFPYDSYSWTANQPIIRGSKPLTSPAFAADLPKPEPPLVVNVPLGKEGYAGGARLLFITFTRTGREGLHTLPSEPTEFTLGDGQGFRYIPPSVASGVPAGAKVGIWITNAAPFGLPPDPATARLQRVIPAVGTAVEFTGPFHAGRRLPAFNETIVARPRPLRIAGRGAEVQRRNIPARLMAGNYRFAHGIVYPGGGEVVSFPSNVVQVAGERVTRRVPNDGSANVRAEVSAPNAGANAYEPPEESHQAEGKKPPEESAYVARGGQYLGEEIDAEESRLYGLVNARRRDSGAPILVLSSKLNTEAYRRVSGPNDSEEPGYPGAEHAETVETRRDDADEAMRLLHSGRAGKRRYEAVGIAREPAPGGFRWCVVYGDTDDSPEMEEIATFEFVDDDGVVHTCDASGLEEANTQSADAFADATLNPPQGWSCVKNNSLDFSYSGSFGAAVSNGTAAWQGKCRVSVNSGGSVVRVTDGAISSYARCHSDGRIILNASKFSQAAASANKQAVMHEFGHALGLAHNSGNSVMQPSINTSGSGNIASPTSSDVNTVVSVWGDAQADPGTGGGGDPPQEPQAPKFRYETVTLPYRRGEAFRVARPRPTPGSVGWRLYAQINGAWHNLHGSAAPNGATAYFAWRRAVVFVYGSPEELAPIFQGVRWSLTQTELPQENTTAIEPPGAAPELPANFLVGGVMPATNKNYWIRVADTVRTADGVSQSVASDPVKHFLPTGNTFRVVFSDQMNRLRNAEGRDRDRDGRPSDWTITTSNGSYEWSEGRHTLSTLGATTGSTPEASPPSFDANPSGSYTVVGKLIVESQAGSGELVLLESNASGAVVRTTVLKSLSGVGEARVERVFSPGSLHPDTAAMRVRGRMAGATKNLSMIFYDLAVHPFEAAPRKVEEGAPGEAANFSPAPEKGFPSGPLSVVGPPPATGSEVAANPPIEVLDFNVSDGLNWPVSKSPAATVSEFMNLSDGKRGWRSQDPTTNVSAYVRRARSFTAEETDGTKLAIRAQFVVRGGIGAVASYVVQPLVVNDAAGAPLAFLYLTANGRVHMYLRRGANYVGPYGLGYWQPGNELDVELIFSNVGSSASRVDALFGKDGSARTPVSTVVIDWTGRAVNSATFGVVSESSAASKADLLWRRVSVTESGELIEGVGQPPALEPYATPDRPSYWSAPLYEGTGATDRTTGADGASFAGRDSLAVSATVDPSALPTADKLIADVRSSSGATLADIIMTPAGDLTLRAGTRTRQIAQGLTASSSALTVELVVAGAGTLSGAAQAFYTPPDSTVRRLLGLLTGLDLTNLYAERAVVPAGTTYTVGAVKITESGSLTYRDLNERGETINQWYIVVPPGVTRTVDAFYRMPVVPGVTYNLAIRGRHFRPGGLLGAAVFPFHVTLHSESGRTLDCGSVYGEAGCVGREDWSEKVLVFTVPEDFGATEARFHHTDLGEGVYIFQDVRPAKGAEPKEGYARAIGPAEMITTLAGFNDQASPFAPDFRIPMQIAQAVPASVPDGCAVEVSYSSSEDGIAYSSEAHDPAVVLPAKHLRVSQILYGDGTLTPVVPPGSPSLRTLAMTGELCDEDGSPVGAGIFASGLHEPIFRPEYATETIGGRAQTTSLTEAIGRIEQSFKLLFLRSADARRFAEDCVSQEWEIEAPYLMRDLYPSGVALRVVFRGVLDPVESTRPISWASSDGTIHRHVWATVDVEGVDVLGAGPLDVEAAASDVLEAEIVSEDSLWV